MRMHCMVLKKSKKPPGLVTYSRTVHLQQLKATSVH